jgi:hypothetical protein
MLIRGGSAGTCPQIPTYVDSGKALFTGILRHCPQFLCDMATRIRYVAHAKPENRPPSNGSCNSL